MVAGIIITTAVVGILSILIGIFLGVASEKFKIEVDEKEILVRNELPGNNCGGCGYAGCDTLAKAITAGQADVGAYPVSGASAAEKIGAIISVAGETTEKKVAFAKCKGTCDKMKVQYNYYDVDDYKKVSVVPGAGEKARTYECMGCDSCMRACAFDAIHVMGGVAAVGKERYAAYGECVSPYPNNLIELAPYKSEHLVQCSSHAKGKDVEAVYESGCVGCTLYTKQCEFDAIHMENNLAVIDYEKYTNCSKCAEKCPVEMIL